MTLRILAVLVRFPAAMAAALAIAFAIADFHYSGSYWLIGIAAVFAWATALQLAVESRPELPNFLRIMLPWLSAVILLGPALEGKAWWPGPVLAGAGILAILAVPCFRSREEWQAVADAWLRACTLAVAIAVLAGLLFLAGISLLLVGIDSLFRTAIYQQGDNLLAALSIGILMPWCGLFLLPLPSPEIAGSYRFPRWLDVLVSWLLAPMVLIYGAVLNLYCLFLIVQGAMPNGAVAPMVVGIAVIGAIVWGAAGLVEGRFARWLQVAFFPGLIAPALALSVAAWIRTANHGMTEARYLLFLLAAFLVGLGLWQVLRRRTPAPAQAALVGAILLLAVSVGPWGMTGLAVRSQQALLVGWLEQAGRMNGGYIDIMPGEVGSAYSSRIQAAVTFLVNRGEADRVTFLFRDQAQLASAMSDAGSRTEGLLLAMGVPSLPCCDALDDVNKRYVSWRARHTNMVSVAGFDTYAPHLYLSVATRPIRIEAAGGLEMLLDLEAGQLKVRRGATVFVAFALGDIVIRVEGKPADPIILDATADDGTRLRLILSGVGATRTMGGKLRLVSLQAALLVAGPPP